MVGKPETDKIRRRASEWSKKSSRDPHRQRDFKTLSGSNVEPVYTPAHLEDFDYLRDLGFPGEYPFVRGVQNTGTGEDCGQCACFQGWAPPRNLTHDTSTSWSTERQGLALPSIMQL